MNATRTGRVPENLPMTGRLQRYFGEQPELGVAAVYLFGSHAARRAHRESDVDLGVLLRWSAKPERRDRFDVRVRLAGELARLVAPGEPDVVILNDAPPLLGRHIVVSGVRIYLADVAADHAYQRDVQLRAADLAPFLRRMRQLKLDFLDRRTVS
jgi:predicted nucleotidyltransferase